MFASVLIANRGEIAVRIARTAKRLGIRTIAVYSEADANALHVRVCDEAHCIGPAPARESYLVVENILAVARASKAECIHPGYGFLSENADFAQACADAGIVFVGPPPDAIRAMGLKDRAKALMVKAGVPVVPGYLGDMQDPVFLKRKAYELGYPVLIKAVAGGGGKGMRRVDLHAEFDTALESAQREAKSSFGEARVLIEKYAATPRHIEVQVFGDRHGNVIHLNERDCSLQRRHQKVIEESPAPGMTRELRAVMGEAAAEAARAVGYVGAGTVEFIADGSQGLRADAFWFMEMNTRLQVEHPVTEAVTGLDLVEWQFRIAHGEALPLRQEEVALNGHAVEARLYAEDPEHGFLPSTGTLHAFGIAGDVRIDTGVEQGSAVTPYYDAMIAKLIAHAPTRDGALDKLADALDRTVVAGPKTNAAFLAALARADGFRAGKFDTGFIDRNLEALGAVPREPDAAAAATGVLWLLEEKLETIAASKGLDESRPVSPWDAIDGFQFSGARIVEYPIVVDDRNMAAKVLFGPDDIHVEVGGERHAGDAHVVPLDAGAVYIVRHGRQTVVRFSDAQDVSHDAAAGGGEIRAPMHGKVLAVLVDKDDMVRKGQRLAIIEAMKMEHALLAPFDGRVTAVSAVVGHQIAEKAAVMVIEAEESK
jgi:3-methylcrotonyl-CoA carboxylase alpha subunit